MNEKIKEQETRKYRNLLQAAQSQLDAMVLEKAPKDSIKHMEQRVKALEGRLKKLESIDTEVVEPKKDADVTGKDSDKTKSKKR